MHKNTGLIESIKVFVQKLNNQQPLILDYFPSGNRPRFKFGPQLEKGARLLLVFSSLYQDISEENLVELLLELEAEFAEGLFSLNKIPFETLRDFLNNSLYTKNWSLLPKAPGILRSVSDFFLTNGNVLEQASKHQSSESLVNLLSQSIFYMGKHSANKFKARYFIWLLIQANVEIGRLLWNDTSRLPLTIGAGRLLKLIGPLKGNTREFQSPEEKLNYFNRFYCYLFPSDHWRVFAPFDAFLKKTSITTYCCQQMLGGCILCPLHNQCPGCSI